jgi:peptidoglycan/xylan/chitin deacetylase (PgdA/CDA1 family)
MEWLHGHGFHAISERELFDALEWSKPLPPRPVLITFDDGYRDVLYNAEPVLRPLHMPATAFVISDRISRRDPSFLTWRDLRDLEHDGFAIGSHTVHHLNLTTLPTAQARLELVQYARRFRSISAGRSTGSRTRPERRTGRSSGSSGAPDTCSP